MTIALKSLSWLCFAYCCFYALTSLYTFFWASARHGGRLLFLEWQPHRALGRTEASRARKLRRMAAGALLAFPAGIAASVVSLIHS